MSEIIKKEHIQEYEKFLKNHPKGHFCQSVLWAKQKPMWDWEAIVSRDSNGNIKGSLAFLIRKILPGLPFTMLYGCRGPVTNIDDHKTIIDLIEGAKKLAKRKHAYVIKIDPDISSSEKQYITILKNLGFKLSSEGATFDSIQPRYVFRLNTLNKSPEDILAAFPQSTRRKIRIPKKRGVSIKIQGNEAISDFAALMKETGIRDGFITREANYFENLLNNLGKHARLYMAYYKEKAIAGSIAIWYGDKVWYLYGASSNENRNLMPNYALQWSMIKWAIEKRCRLYDFRGVPGHVSTDHPLYGLYRFKYGFRGDYTEFIGEMDMIINKPVNWFISKIKPMFMNLRQRIYMKRNKK